MAQLDRLFDSMLNAGASDLHLAENHVPKIRLHGKIMPVPNAGPIDGPTLTAMMKELCLPNFWQEFIDTGDLDFAYGHGSKARFRANYHRNFNGVGAVFRTIPSRILTLQQLRVPSVLESFGHFNSGLVLVTGPTGSGKSTTLAAIIDSINANYARHIVTIEEPIEFVHAPKKSTIVQREVGIHAHSFADALRSATRQDLDVILVGEMRDLETISLAVTAAETGTLVFGTLHTNSAIKTIDRIIDVFPADQQTQIRSMLAVSLRAVCAQLLLRTNDGSGRRAANEILLQTRAVSNYIREGKTNQINQIIMSSRQVGMQLMDDAIEDYLREGIVSPQEAYMKALDKDRFRRYMRAELP
ncbi:PilT/PilU family type 4a pilus ATPase [bacterium]|nr:PilT/PilU family type 4a pilus ATPase [bacterium]